jgi:hypothetical protein
MDSRVNSFFNSFIQGIPIFTGYLIFLGAIKCLIFYLLFNIDLLDYLSFSELIIMTLYYFILIGFAVVLVVLWAYRPLMKEISATNSISFIGKWWSKLRKFVSSSLESKKVKKSIYFVLLVALAGGFSIYFFSMTSEKKFWWSQLVMLSICSALFLLGTKYISRMRKMKLLGTFTKAISISVYLLTLFVIFADVDSNLHTMLCNPGYHAMITMKNKSALTTSDSLVYLGQKEKYLFLYNKTNSAPEIISNDEIVSVKFKKITR